MSMETVTNALIESTMLGTEGQGILTWYLMLKFPPGGQGFGGFALDQWNQSKSRRIGTEWGMESIARILNTVGVDKWEDLPGKHVRIVHVGGSWNVPIVKIGHIVENKWFDPRADLAFLAHKEAQ